MCSKARNLGILLAAILLPAATQQQQWPSFSWQQWEHSAAATDNTREQPQQTNRGYFGSSETSHSFSSENNNPNFGSYQQSADRSRSQLHSFGSSDDSYNYEQHYSGHREQPRGSGGQREQLRSSDILREQPRGFPSSSGGARELQQLSQQVISNGYSRITFG